MDKYTYEMCGNISIPLPEHWKKVEEVMETANASNGDTRLFAEQFLDAYFDRIEKELR